MNAIRTGLGALVLACLALGAFSSAQAGTPSAALTYRWNQPAFQEQVIGLLAMNTDGTIRVTNWSRAQKLFGKDFVWAMEDLQSYNDRILSRAETRLASIEELSQHAIVLTRETLAGAQRQDLPGFVMASTAPNCRGGWIGVCDRGGYCCCGGWWFFCTQYCTCTPK